MGETPAVRQDDASGLLIIDWPKTRPTSFEIAADVFEALVTMINVERMANRG